MEYFKFLPVEITLDILTRLPTEDVLECKLVCTNWRSLVRHPLFSKMHFHHLSNSDSGKLGFIAKTRKRNANNNKFEYFEYDQDHNELTTTPIVRISRINFKRLIQEPKFVGSCNGLICLSFARPTHNPFCIYNPITREYVLLPLIKDIRKKNIHWRKGFGYVSSTNEYKIVVLIWKKTGFYDVYVYTLGSGNGWRNLQNMNLVSSESWGQVIFADEALYWESLDSELMLRFDLAEEKFCKHFSPPPLPPDGRRSRKTVGVLDGFLYYAVWLVVEGAGSYDVWLLKKKNDNHDILEQGELQSLVWSKEFRIGRSNLLAVTKTGDMLTYNSHYLNICDLKASTSKRLVYFDEILKVFPHKNTLVSLKELGEEDAKIMEAVDQP